MGRFSMARTKLTKTITRMETVFYHDLSHVERAFADIAQVVGHEQIETLKNGVVKYMADGYYQRCKYVRCERRVPLIMASDLFNACMDAAAKAAGITLDRDETLNVRLYLAHEIVSNAFDDFELITQIEEN